MGGGGEPDSDHQCILYTSISSQKTDPISLDHQLEGVQVTFLAKGEDGRGGEREIKLIWVKPGIVLYLLCNIILLKTFFNQYGMEF